MNRKQSRITFGIFVVFVFLNLNNPTLGQKTKLKETLKINATIVAYDILSLEANFDVRSEILFVKIRKIKKGKEKSRYLVITRFHSTDDSLVEKIINGKVGWFFGLTRATYCDAKLRDFEYITMTNMDGLIVRKDKRLEFIGESNETNLPMDEMLPCYLLSNNFKVVD